MKLKDLTYSDVLDTAIELGYSFNRHKEFINDYIRHQKIDFLYDYPYLEIYNEGRTTPVDESDLDPFFKLQVIYTFSEKDYKDLMKYIVSLYMDNENEAESIKSQIIEKVIRRQMVLTWKVEGETLTVGGVREIKDYSHEEPPWADSLDVIQRIVIEEGVEKISANAFAACRRLEQVIIPASVMTIGDFAFTICYCGDKAIDGGKNVIWSLDDGVLLLKKNPAAMSDADFSTGYEMWNVAGKNIKSIKIERGVIPGRRFFEWLGRLSVNLQMSLI